jgi:hypothetical protein
MNFNRQQRNQEREMVWIEGAMIHPSLLLARQGDVAGLPLVPPFPVRYALSRPHRKQRLLHEAYGVDMDITHATQKRRAGGAGAICLCVMHPPGWDCDLIVSPPRAAANKKERGRCKPNPPEMRRSGEAEKEFDWDHRWITT